MTKKALLLQILFGAGLLANLAALFLRDRVGELMLNLLQGTALVLLLVWLGAQIFALLQRRFPKQ